MCTAHVPMGQFNMNSPRRTAPRARGVETTSQTPVQIPLPSGASVGVMCFSAPVFMEASPRVPETMEADTDVGSLSIISGDTEVLTQGGCVSAFKRIFACFSTAARRRHSFFFLYFPESPLFNVAVSTSFFVSTSVTSTVSITDVNATIPSTSPSPVVFCFLLESPGAVL